MLFLLFLLSLLLNVSVSVVYRPAVLMHGITSNAAGMDDVAQWIRSTFDGIYVVSIEIGNGKFDSYSMSIDKQIELFCKTVESDLQLRQGFNLLGYSQGSIIVRGAVQRCSLPVFNLITLSGIHQGIFGVPFLTQIPEQYRDLITKYAYEPGVQELVSPASYWRDPYQLARYSYACKFLPDINNELVPKNEIYRTNMLKLNSFVMTYSDIDEVIQPRESGLFLGYQNHTLDVETRNMSRQFTEDLLGLRTLNEQGRLFTFTSHCKHQDGTHEPNKQFLFENIVQFFNNTFA